MSDLTAEGITASFIKIDLNDFTTLHEAADKVGTLDLLVNNAGIPGNIATHRGQKICSNQHLITRLMTSVKRLK